MNSFRADMKGKKIFLTGGTGFFGKSILDYLISRKMDEVSLTILTRSPRTFQQKYPRFASLPNTEYLQGDVRDFPFPNQEFDLIIHAATPTSNNLPESELASIILDGTAHVLDFAKHSNTKRLLFTSSGAVYGIQPPEVDKIHETMPCHPETAYGRNKLLAEQMCQEFGITTVIARCFSFCGPYLDHRSHFAIENFIRACLMNQDIVIEGDGTPVRSYLYSDDLVEWLFKLLIHGKHTCPYNVGSDQAVSIKELAETVRTVLESHNKIIIKGAPVPGMAPSRYIPDIQRATEELHLSVKTSLPNAIRKTIKMNHD